MLEPNNNITSVFKSTANQYLVIFLLCTLVCLWSRHVQFMVHGSSFFGLQTHYCVHTIPLWSQKAN